MKKLIAALSVYRPSYPRALIYMLQSTEYEIGPYVRWVTRTDDFSQVMKRRTLEMTRASRMLLLALRLGILLHLIVGFSLVWLGLDGSLFNGQYIGLIIIILYPFVWAYLLTIPILLGRWFIIGPSNKLAIEESALTFNQHPGVKIAVAGSYGKTTMKELLNTVLSEGLDVAATPANKNVAISHARFARQLTGHEDVLIIEYGEGAPGDVVRFASTTDPTHAIVTGLAPAHLDHYKTLHDAGVDIMAVADYLEDENVYINADSPSLKPFIKKSHHAFDEHGALGWKASAVTVELDGTRFTLKKGKQTLKLHSGLVGRHQIGFLSLVAALGLELGLTESQVQAGLSKTRPFEHRMQPYHLSGAWVIDDTYNGNLEGIRAGTELLKDLKAKRKIYVTPGLVDQGEETKKVHHEVGTLIAAAKPDMVVLMQNSVTEYIQEGLKTGKYAGEVRMETNPLEFYTNLKHFVAHGDLVVMQNDWTDNYA